MVDDYFDKQMKEMDQKIANEGPVGKLARKIGTSLGSGQMPDDVVIQKGPTLYP